MIGLFIDILELYEMQLVLVAGICICKGASTPEQYETKSNDAASLAILMASGTKLFLLLIIRNIFYKTSPLTFAGTLRQRWKIYQKG